MAMSSITRSQKLAQPANEILHVKTGSRIIVIGGSKSVRCCLDAFVTGPI